MRFAVAGEGLTDFKVVKNLLIGFFKNKDLPITRLLPKDYEPIGWGNVLKYLGSDEFKTSFEFNDFVVVQIDSDECVEWVEGIKHIGNKQEELGAFIEQLKTTLIKHIGKDFYDTQMDKIIFAICVHEIECWLLPFNTTQKAHSGKMVNCAETLEAYCKKQGFSIHQKNYLDGKHYDLLSKEMKDHRILSQKSALNPSLNYFINTLQEKFPDLTPFGSSVK